MKKIALILLILTYSISTIGVSLREFYCCGEFQSITVSLISIEKEKCNKGDNKEDCCQSKYHILKVKDQHLASDQPTLPFKHSIELFSPTQLFEAFLIVPQKVSVINGSHAPPLYAGTPVYIYNCVFRI